MSLSSPVFSDTRAVVVQTTERRPSTSISGVWSKGEFVQLTDISPTPPLNFTGNMTYLTKSEKNGLAFLPKSPLTLSDFEWSNIHCV